MPIVSWLYFSRPVLNIWANSLVVWNDLSEGFVGSQNIFKALHSRILLDQVKCSCTRLELVLLAPASETC